MNIRDVMKKVAKFAEERRESDGGWAPVTEDDMDQLRYIIDALLLLKFAEAPTVICQSTTFLVDRTKYEPMHYEPLPYKTEASFVERLNIAMMNAEIAQDRARQIVRLYIYDEREKQKKEKA